MKEVPSDMFRDCSSMEAITLPASIKSIGSSAFEGCTSLSSIVIPIGVKDMGGSAFAKCANLMDVTVQGIAPPKISGSTFAKSTEKEGTLHVKSNAYNAFTNNKQWNRFLTIVKQ